MNKDINNANEDFAKNDEELISVSGGVDWIFDEACFVEAKCEHCGSDFWLNTTGKKFGKESASCPSCAQETTVSWNSSTQRYIL